MKHPKIPPGYILLFCLLTMNIVGGTANAQNNQTVEQVKNASKKVKSGLEKENTDTLAQGYFELGETYYQQGDFVKSEAYYQKAKDIFLKQNNTPGIARTSRAIARIKEEQYKNDEALSNYATARDNTLNAGDTFYNTLNTNDFNRLTWSSNPNIQDSLISQNIQLMLKRKDTGEIISNYSRLGAMNLKQKRPDHALAAYTNGYSFTAGMPSQASYFNQQITNIQVQQNDLSKAIQTKESFLQEPFVQNSSQMKAREMNLLAGIYLLKKEDSTALKLLHEAYDISVKNGHTLEAKNSVEKIDSLLTSEGKKDASLELFRKFLKQLPGIISKDSSITDNRLLAETEERIKQLENEKVLNDALIKKKNFFNYLLTGFIILLAIFISVMFYTRKKLRVNNQKIALQSLRREMNPHFIFNSLNGINQFIANNNELEANRYLSRYSLLMRRVLENSAEDYILLSKETEMLQLYLELEKSRFPDKFDYLIDVDEALLAEENLQIPGMMIQPHVENAIWHGLRYSEDKGMLQVSIKKLAHSIEITIDDNGIGITESEKAKTVHQKEHSGRGIKNMMERIKLLNGLYRRHITCNIRNKPCPDKGVTVQINIPHRFKTTG